jgi:hypothetical protein
MSESHRPDPEAVNRGDATPSEEGTTAGYGTVHHIHIFTLNVAIFGYLTFSD